jgi:hypothetical protein
LGKVRVTKEKIIKSQLDKATGYYKIVLYLNRKGKQQTVHRLVALTFLPNPDNLGYINHKDENKGDNHFHNLEWCTGKYNLEYSHVRERNMEHHRKVLQFNKDGEVVCKYRSTGDAARAMGIAVSAIRLCCVGKIGSVKQFIWRYEDQIDISSKNPRHRRIIQRNMNGVCIGMYNSIKEAAQSTGTNETGILNCCKGKYSQSNGFLWEYRDHYQKDNI